MLGAIIGDIVGSIYEFYNIHSKDFEFFGNDCHFTDDSVMTTAIAHSLIVCGENFKNLSKLATRIMVKYGQIYPYASYGSRFMLWLDNPVPYNSFGNGAAMRVSPVAYFAKDIEEVKDLSRKVTEVSHNHEEGIKGAEATAVAIFLALQKKSKDEIKRYIEENYYSLDFNYDDLVKNYEYSESCQGTVPQAIYCFLISKSFEDAIRTGISIGGDSDTLCAITGAIAEAFYGIPADIEEMAMTYLDENIKSVYKKFKQLNRYKSN